MSCEDDVRAIAQPVDAGAHEVGVVLFSNCAHGQWIFRYKTISTSSLGASLWFL